MIKVGDNVQWTHKRHIYRGVELSLKEGTVLALEGGLTIIKPPNKYAARQRVPVLRLKVKPQQTTGAAE